MREKIGGYNILCVKSDTDTKRAQYSVENTTGGVKKTVLAISPFPAFTVSGQVPVPHTGASTLGTYWYLILKPHFSFKHNWK